MTTPTKVIHPPRDGLAPDSNNRGLPRPRLNRLTIRPEPVGETLRQAQGETLTRAELIAGLRRVVQQARVELAAESDREEARRYAFAIACVLDDVAEQFGLNYGERVEIIGEAAMRDA
ncbi:MAG: hypothetical protein AAB217_18315 [Chloroflexota bacterium]